MENLKILSEKENLLFSRKEIVIEIKSEKVPKKTEVENLLSEKFSVKPETIEIDRIVSKFGSRNFTVYARIYKSKEDKEKIESRTKKDKAKPGGDKKQE